MTRKTLPLLVLAALAAFIATGCSKDDDTVNPAPMGTLRVALTDAPNQEVEAVNLVVTRVEIHHTGSDTSTGWTTLTTDSASYNLILLRNGTMVNIAQVSVPAGSYDQVRLILGANNTVVVDGVTHPLTVPSGQTSGVKVFGTFNVPAGGTQEIVLDWDAARSVHETGAGDWIMNPVVRLVVLSQTGRISGTVLPTSVTTTVRALSGGDTIQTTVPGPNGNFTLAALLPGSYTVSFDPDTGYRDTSLTNIAVTAGATTSVDTLTLTAQ